MSIHNAISESGEGRQETLVRSYGFKELGGKVYLPLPLPTQFERRAAVRAA